MWVSGEDPGSQQAESTLIAPDAASARYELRPTLPGLDRSQWSLTLCQVLNNGATRPISLGAHASDVIAKVYARKWEQHGTPDGRPSVEER